MCGGGGGGGGGEGMAGAREEEIEGRRRGVKGVKERVVSFRRKYMYMLYNQQLTPCNDSDQYYEICCTCTCSYIQRMAHVYTLYSFPLPTHISFCSSLCLSPLPLSLPQFLPLIIPRALPVSPPLPPPTAHKIRMPYTLQDHIAQQLRYHTLH